MSRVTNVIVSHGIVEDPRIRALLCAPFTAHNQALACISEGAAGEAWGGHKHPEVDIYAAALNGITPEQMLNRIIEIPWGEPGNVQVMIQGQDDDRFAIWEFDDEEILVCVVEGGDRG